MGVRPLLLNLVTAFNASGIKDAQNKLNNLGGTLDKISGKALKAGASFVAFQGGQIIADFASDAIVQARDLERNLIAVDTVFGDFSNTIDQFSLSAQNFGLSQSEAAKASVFLGSVLKQSGFSMEQVSEQTQRLVELGADLSITYGYDVQEALLGMTALFRGEYDPIEKFGVAMKQSEINAELAARGLDKLEGAERRLAEQQIRLQLLFERSTDAQGAFARGSGTLFAEQQKLEAAINNMLQQAGTPLLKTMADLAMAMTPLVEEITPTLVAQFERFIPVGESADETAQKLVDTLKSTIETIGGVIEFLVRTGQVIAENIEALTRLAVAYYALRGVDKVFVTITTAIAGMKATTVGAEVAAKNLRAAIARTGIGLAVIAIGLFVEKVIQAVEASETATISAEKYSDKVYEQGDAFNYASKYSLSYFNQTSNLNIKLQETMKNVEATSGELNRFNNIKLRDVRQEMIDTANAARDLFGGTTFTGSGGTLGFLQTMFPDTFKKGTTTDDDKEKIRNYVQEFFTNLEDETKKVAARAKLESLGASDALIDSIVGFGEGWEKVFDNIVKGGRVAVKDLQDLFDSTQAGIEALEAIQRDFDKQVEQAAQKRFDRLQEEYEAAKKFADDMQEAADDARNAFADFFEAFNVLDTVSQDMGKFEQQTVSALESINDELKRTLEDFITEGGNSLFQQAYNELSDYADKELAKLRDIQRERDQLAQRRSLIESITADVMRAGNVVQLLAQINDKLDNNKDKTTKVIQDTVKAGKRLQDFRVSIITNLVDPLEQVGGKADMLVDSYKAVVDRTRTFVENLKALRQLGLDPQLFNQLVEAGVEAGGETAQALVDGGAKTVQEINNLTRELNQLGAEIGAETASVMYDTGETFINSILAGIQSKQTELENQARSMADAFTKAFQSKLDLSVGTIAAEAAIAVPPAPQMEQVTKDVSASLNQLDALIKGAASFANSTKNAAYQAGALAKKDIFEQLKSDVLQGLDVNLAGVQSGLSTKELESITGKQSNVNITIAPTVYADTRAGGTAAAQTTVKLIKDYVDRNGSVENIVSGSGGRLLVR